MTAKDLDALAKELRLTPKQRAFAEALAADPDGHQTRAALAAGLQAKSAPQTAHKWLKLAKIQKYLSAIRKTAEDLVARKTGRECASLAEALEILTHQARARTGEFITPGGGLDIAAVRAAPAGAIQAIDLSKGKVALSSHGAAIALVKYHSGGFAPSGGQAQPINLQVWMEVVQNANANGNGNGDFRGRALKVLSAAEVGVNGNGQPSAR